MSNLFHLIMEADGDLVEPFDAGSAAETVESEAEPPQENSQPENAPPLADGGDEGLAEPFDDTASDEGDYDDTGDEGGNEEDQKPDESLSQKANDALNQSLYKQLIDRNTSIDDTLKNLQTITPVLPYDVIQANDISINRLKAALSKGQSYALEKFVDSKYGENKLFYEKLNALYVLLLNEINKNLKKVKF